MAKSPFDWARNQIAVTFPHDGAGKHALPKRPRVTRSLRRLLCNTLVKSYNSVGCSYGSALHSSTQPRARGVKVLGLAGSRLCSSERLRGARWFSSRFFRLGDAGFHALLGDPFGFSSFVRFLGKSQRAQSCRLCIDRGAFLCDLRADHLVAALGVGEVTLCGAAGRVSPFTGIGHGRFFLSC